MRRDERAVSSSSRRSPTVVDARRDVSSSNRRRHVVDTSSTRRVGPSRPRGGSASRHSTSHDRWISPKGGGCRRRRVTGSTRDSIFRRWMVVSRCILWTLVHRSYSTDICTIYRGVACRRARMSCIRRTWRRDSFAGRRPRPRPRRRRRSRERSPRRCRRRRRRRVLVGSDEGRTRRDHHRSGAGRRARAVRRGAGAWCEARRRRRRRRGRARKGEGGGGERRTRGVGSVDDARVGCDFSRAAGETRVEAKKTRASRARCGARRRSERCSIRCWRWWNILNWT